MAALSAGEVEPRRAQPPGRRTEAAEAVARVLSLGGPPNAVDAARSSSRNRLPVCPGAPRAVDYLGSLDVVVDPLCGVPLFHNFVFEW